jgi:hypothetical protein
MSKAIVNRLIGVSMILACLLAFSSNLHAQRIAHPSGLAMPWACRFLGPDDEKAEGNDPEEEKNYPRSFNNFYRLRCTSAPASSGVRRDAANKVAESWRQLWYRDDPFNAAFHETGSFELLVMIAIMRKIPTPMVDNPAFMRDWMEDCSDRCFMLYGDDAPGARQDWLRLMRLRKEAMMRLGGDPAAKPVLKMLKNSKLYPVK